jgi:hypothetical protein
VADREDIEDEIVASIKSDAASDSDDLYAPADQVSLNTVPQPIDGTRDTPLEELDLNSIAGLSEAARREVADNFDNVADVIIPPLIDAVSEDDLKPNSTYDLRSIVCAWIYRLIAPSDGYSLVSWEQLADRLDTDAELAASLGFDPDETPSEKTLREQWQTRVRPAFRRHVRYMAAECAVRAENYEVETAENIRENLIADYTTDEKPDVDPIGEMEQEIEEDAYTIQANVIRDLCSYDRDDSFEWDGDLITDAAAHMCRRNEFAEQGIKRMGKDYGLIEEHDGGTEEWNVFTPQTFRRTVRNVERKRIESYDRDDEDAYGARWLPAHDLVDPHTVRDNPREALEEAWTIDPHDPDGDTAIWHRRTEEGIKRQLAWLKEQNVIDDKDTFNLRIDYTTHNYSKHSSTKSDPPIGVHKQSHLETGYAWKELQGTIKINGRAFIIASLSFLPTNDQFQGVRYILDRAQELVNIDTVVADAEFVDTKICRYIRHCGCDYAIRKGVTDSVKDTVEDFEGRADWDSDWTLISSGREKTHDTTLVGLETDFKSVPDHKKDDEDDDDELSTTLADFEDEDESEGVGDQQITLDQVVEEAHKDTEEIDYFCIITSKSVDRVGIDPDDNPVAHDPMGTAWGIGRLYRDRWGIETAFRDKKDQFAAKTRSRDLGYRRFLWMMENLLYNGWVMLNTAVSDQSPVRDDDEIVVKQNTYLDELDRRVLSGLSLDLKFPDIEYD